MLKHTKNLAPQLNAETSLFIQVQLCLFSNKKAVPVKKFPENQKLPIFRIENTKIHIYPILSIKHF